MPEDVIQVRDQFYILATAARMYDLGRVLKHNDTFTVFDRHGDIQAFGLGEQGLYHEGTRFLSRFALRLGPDRPLLLSSRVRSENDLFVADLTNPDMTREGRIVLPRDLVHLFRCRFVYGGACYERIRVCSYSQERIELPVWIWFDADYADIFEVRGTPRARRGEGLPPEIRRSAVVLGYRGLDDVVRRTRLLFDPPPDRLEPAVAKFDVALEPHEVATITIVVACEIDDGRRAAPVLPYDAAAVEAARVTERPPAACRVTTSNERFNAWLARSAADVRMMISDTPHGPYPYAGVPWFSTAFGRDGIVTARELLWIDPQLARGVLAYLAATQAATVDEARDAEPGKILHETRRGEMAALGEVPFGLYYGSVDATPLFLMLAGAYYVRTGDLAFIESIWPNIERALAWIDRAGDRDGDGFVEYMRFSPTGLAHQGWKDSSDAVFHADGRLAEPPIALCEVQGYVYDARRSVAILAEALGDRAAADRLRRQAERLRQQVEEAFWIEELSTYALALDGRKQPCRVRTSNAGHLLFCGLPSPGRAARVARTLLDLDSYSGWGIRTVSAAERRYNPMSYHNGSVWPHDNALIAAGLSRYGLQEEVLTVLRGLFDASEHVELCRMPELFCGFHRRPGQGATLYPVACAPQAWAAAAVFLLLEACLGMEIDGRCGTITLRRPRLPDFLREVRVENLRIGSTSVDLLFERHPADVGVSVLRRDGDVEIVVVK